MRLVRLTSTVASEFGFTDHCIFIDFHRSIALFKSLRTCRSLGNEDQPVSSKKLRTLSEEYLHINGTKFFGPDLGTTWQYPLQSEELITRVQEIMSIKLPAQHFPVTQSSTSRGKRPDDTTSEELNSRSNASLHNGGSY